MDELQFIIKIHLKRKFLFYQMSEAIVCTIELVLESEIMFFQEG